LEWKNLSEVLCDKKVSTKHTVLVFRISTLYGSETWSSTHEMEDRMKTVEMRHIFWITYEEHIEHDVIR